MNNSTDIKGGVYPITASEVIQQTLYLCYSPKEQIEDRNRELFKLINMLCSWTACKDAQWVRVPTYRVGDRIERYVWRGKEFSVRLHKRVIKSEYNAIKYQYCIALFYGRYRYQMIRIYNSESYDQSPINVRLHDLYLEICNQLGENDEK